MSEDSGERFNEEHQRKIASVENAFVRNCPLLAAGATAGNQGRACATVLDNLILDPITMPLY
ncbi:hypothetical protein [Actinomadura sp. RB99]|uniref:hypothetical protein n=1 Tax=Actinomadura sp. RB99 TaxID=2691577 RepID=UPI0019D5423E|nr:hypothetical protein [Actinomadura sp. RB99]